MSITQLINIRPPAVPRETEGECDMVEQVQDSLQTINQYVKDNKLPIIATTDLGDWTIRFTPDCKCGNNAAYLDGYIYRCAKCKSVKALLVVGAVSRGQVPD